MVHGPPRGEDPLASRGCVVVALDEGVAPGSARAALVGSTCCGGRAGLVTVRVRAGGAAGHGLGVFTPVGGFWVVAVIAVLPGGPPARTCAPHRRRRTRPGLLRRWRRSSLGPPLVGDSRVVGLPPGGRRVVPTGNPRGAGRTRRTLGPPANHDLSGANLPPNPFPATRHRCAAPPNHTLPTRHTRMCRRNQEPRPVTNGALQRPRRTTPTDPCGTEGAPPPGTNHPPTPRRSTPPAPYRRPGAWGTGALNPAPGAGLPGHPPGDRAGHRHPRTNTPNDDDPSPRDTHTPRPPPAGAHPTHYRWLGFGRAVRAWAVGCVVRAPGRYVYVLWT